jgi:putative RNA 2'-phosphotransferase
MTRDATHLSKLISYWLRHDPADGRLVLDEYGWTGVDDLVRGLAARQYHVTLDDIERLNLATDKVRWVIDRERGRLRANHGHSVAVAEPGQPSTPPATLYHGTAQRFLAAIERDGLQPMSRQQVHLSDDITQARTVGARHGTPVALTVETAPLVAAGWDFYDAGEGVWLTAAIPWSYLEVADE